MAQRGLLYHGSIRDNRKCHWVQYLLDDRADHAFRAVTSSSLFENEDAASKARSSFDKAERLLLNTSLAGQALAAPASPRSGSDDFDFSAEVDLGPNAWQQDADGFVGSTPSGDCQGYPLRAGTCTSGYDSGRRGYLMQQSGSHRAPSVRDWCTIDQMYAGTQFSGLNAEAWERNQYEVPEQVSAFEAARLMHLEEVRSGVSAPVPQFVWLCTSTIPMTLAMLETLQHMLDLEPGRQVNVLVQFLCLCACFTCLYPSVLMLSPCPVLCVRWSPTLWQMEGWISSAP
jgi:hypothetical protein